MFKQPSLGDIWKRLLPILTHFVDLRWDGTLRQTFPNMGTGSSQEGAAWRQLVELVLKCDGRMRRTVVAFLAWATRRLRTLRSPLPPSLALQLWRNSDATAAQRQQQTFRRCRCRRQAVRRRPLACEGRDERTPTRAGPDLLQRIAAKCSAAASGCAGKYVCARLRSIVLQFDQGDCGHVDFVV